MAYIVGITPGIVLLQEISCRTCQLGHVSHVGPATPSPRPTHPRSTVPGHMYALPPGAGHTLTLVLAGGGWCGVAGLCMVGGAGHVGQLLPARQALVVAY